MIIRLHHHAAYPSEHRFTQTRLLNNLRVKVQPSTAKLHLRVNPSTEISMHCLELFSVHSLWHQQTKDSRTLISRYIHPKRGRHPYCATLNSNPWTPCYNCIQCKPTSLRSQKEKFQSTKFILPLIYMQFSHSLPAYQPSIQISVKSSLR